DDGHSNVRVKERATDLANRRVDVCFAQAALAAQVAEGRGEAIGKIGEHQFPFGRGKPQAYLGRESRSLARWVSVSMRPALHVVHALGPAALASASVSARSASSRSLRQRTAA